MKLSFKGAIFDLDGVITDTAEIHFKAWKKIFDSFLKEFYDKKRKKFIPFTKQDYLRYVDGIPRYKGVESFLDSRKIKIPKGNESDSESKQTIYGLGKKKNSYYKGLIKKEKPKVFDSTVSLIKKLRKNKIKIGIISSSKNCKLILKKTDLLGLADKIIDGKDSEKIGLKGKPEPDIFLKASEKLNLKPGECLVVEDAVKGVLAGQKGNFGLVVGLQRGEEMLETADIIVKSLKKFNDLDKMEKEFVKNFNKKKWELNYYEYLPEKERIRETLCTIGNGYFGTRGCFITEDISNPDEHYPGTYVNGIYNKARSKVKGKEIYNSDLVNLPNWLFFKIKIGKEFLNPFDSEILHYKRNLDMKNAVLTQEIKIKDKKDRITRITTERFANMSNKNTGALKVKFASINYSEKISFVSGIDGDVKNLNVKRYRMLNQNHLKTTSKKHLKKNFMQLNSKTKDSDYDISISLKNDLKYLKKYKTNKISKKNFIGEEFSFDSEKGKEYYFEKIISLYTSKDSKNPKKDSEKNISKVLDFTDLLKEHKKSWKKIWEISNIKILGDLEIQKLIHLDIYHLFTTFSKNSKGLDIGIPARGIHGEAYRGHIFWDEIFILPFYLINFPDIAREHLIYRFNRLKQAKEYAKSEGYEGAMFPWQSADTGEEESQKIHYNPVGDSWGLDLSKNQRHISIAVFYDFWEYYSLTQDKKFMKEYGLEVLLEIAKFWASISKYDNKKEKYSIEGVMGPDEFHEKYPNSKKPGLKDNAYTNVMVSWLLKKILELISDFNKENLVSEKEKKKYKEISENLEIHSEEGIVEQFKGYFDLKEINWDKYMKKYRDIHRMDRILKAEGKSPDAYKVTKQGDFLMLYYLLQRKQVTSLLKNLGVNIRKPRKFLKRNYEYYQSRTSHGSTLSSIVHGIIAFHLNKEKEARKFFEEALKSDYSEKESTAEGVHCGIMAGSLDFITRIYAGIDYSNEILHVNPQIPEDWKGISLKLKHRNIDYDFEINHKNLKIKSNKKTKINVRGKVFELNKKTKIIFN